MREETNSFQIDLRGASKCGILLLAVLLLSGCMSMRPRSRVSIPPPPAVASCMDCHDQEYKTWSYTAHADSEAMSRTKGVSDNSCIVCHEVNPAHAEEPDENPPRKIQSMSKSEQNALCGRCHYSKDLFGWSAIDPKGRHGLFMSVGFDESYKRQLSCLDCHKGHGKHSDMLVTMKAHVCYTCHKEAIVTMGIVQPINYLTLGKACRACHTVHGASTVKQWAYTCVGTYVTVGAACNACHISKGASLQWWVN